VFSQSSHQIFHPFVRSLPSLPYCQSTLPPTYLLVLYLQREKKDKVN
jgi:hypothetical protein